MADPRNIMSNCTKIIMWFRKENYLKNEYNQKYCKNKKMW